MQSMITVDAHCDTITRLEGHSLDDAPGQLNLYGLQQGSINLQFFAIFITQAFKGRELEKTLEYIDVFYREMEKAPGLEAVTSWQEIQECIEKGRTAGLLTLEGGEALCGNTGVLRVLYRLGVRSLTLTWNHRNELGDGIGEQNGKGGLSDFGVQVVKEMNRLGMLVDVSHLSARGFWDVMEIATGPVIASHSNARSVYDHPRNLTDSQIKALAEKGGVMGLNFVPAFVGGDKAGIPELLKHVDYVVSLAGVDCLGLGSDFDGVDKAITGLENPGKIPALRDALLNRGYSGSDVEKILGKNFLRVMQSVMH